MPHLIVTGKVKQRLPGNAGRRPTAVIASAESSSPAPSDVRIAPPLPSEILKPRVTCNDVRRRGGGLSVLAGGGVTVVLPVLLALGLSADQANATNRLNLTVGAVIATIVLARKKKIEWKATVPLLVATVAGAIVGAFAGTFIHSNAMLTIIVLTSVVSMTLVYVKPNRWLSTGTTSPVVPERAGVFIYSLLCFYGGVIAVDSAILRLIVLVLLMGLPLSKANPIKVVTGLALFALSSAIYGDAGKVSSRCRPTCRF
jgi:uncharacterized membrane protein YfcA